MQMSYGDAVEVLRRALVFGIHPSLEGIRELVEELGRPQEAFSAIQVTGTNGKTSTVRYIHALLRAEGHSAGLYTSPELERYPERMQIGEAPATDQEFAGAICAAVEAAERLRPGAIGSDAGFTEFELLTAAALWFFRDQGVDFAVLEVGMGGRWDATSVVAPSVAVITGVGLDHTAILGDTLEKIAAEKAAIIRPASAPVLGPGTEGVDEVFLSRAAELGTHTRAVREWDSPSPVPEELTVRFRVVEAPGQPWGSTTLDVQGIHGAYDSLTIPGPRYQAANVATAVAAAEAALGRPLDTSRARTALARLTVPGRFEIVARDPLVFVDGSHNPQAARVLASAIAEAWDARGLPTILLGVLADKDAEGIVAALAPVAERFVVTAPRSARARSAASLGQIVSAVTGEAPAVIATLEEALARKEIFSPSGLVVTGSLTTAGEARRLLRDTSATGRK